jgi:hypothetical protein
MHPKNYQQIVKGSDNLEYFGVDGNIVSKLIFNQIMCEGADWIHLAQDMVHWRDLVNTVMNLRAP